jgi:hypothetical protein
VKNLYTKSYKTLTKEIEEDTSGKIMYSWIEKNNTEKMTIYPKLFNTVYLKMIIVFFTEIENILQRHWTTKVILNKKNKVGDNIFPHFKMYYKAIVIKTVVH